MNVPLCQAAFRLAVWDRFGAARHSLVAGGCRL